MTEYIPSHLLRKSVIARPIKRVPQKKHRLNDEPVPLKALQRVAEGKQMNYNTLHQLIGMKLVTRVPVLTSKGKKLIET